MQYEVIYTAKDNLETLEAVIVKAESQTDAIKKAVASIIKSGRVVDFIFSASRMAAN